MSVLKYGVEVPYDKPQHALLIERLRDCARQSRQTMTQRHEAWRKNEDLFKFYIKETTEDARRRRNRDNGLPTYTTIVLPYSYAVAMTAVTYWAQMYMGRSPILQFVGRNPQSEDSVSAVEAVHDYQMTVGENVPAWYVWFMDMAKYGFGVVCDYWHEEQVTVSRIEQRPKTWAGIPVPFTDRPTLLTEQVWRYRGNKLFNVRPYDFLPDPRVSMMNFQQGEFCGRTLDLQWHELRARKARGEFFNLDAVEQHCEDFNRDQGSVANLMPNGDSGFGWNKKAPRGTEMVLTVVPRDYDLGESLQPEKWIFTMVQDRVIVGARPQQSNHGRFPYNIITYDINGYEVASFGLLDVMRPLNNVMDWLINTHFFSVRKSLNGNVVVDPSRLIMADITNPQPGRLVRLSPAAYGTDPRTVWAEMSTSEPTAQHLQAIGLFDQIIQRVSGVSESLQGTIAKNRKTAAEVRTAAAGASGRLKLHADWASATGVTPLAHMMLSNTQQFYNWEEVFRISGKMSASREFVTVTPETIAGNYDYVPIDGSLPMDRTATAAVWKELLMVMLQAPALAAGFDVPKLFGYVAQLAGCKHIDQFRVEITPDRLAMAALKSGQAVPLPGGDGRSAMPQGAGYSGDSPSATSQPVQ